MKKILNRTFLFLATAALAMVGCSENDLDDVTLSVDGDNSSYEFSYLGGEHSFIIYSNLAEWELYFMNDDSEWLTVWPKEGDYDGRFTVTAPEYSGAYTREAVLILVSRGEEQGRFNIYQTGISPYLSIASTSDVRVSCLGSQDLRISISSNIGWACSIPEDVDWMRLGSDTIEGAQQLIVDYNEGEERSCTIDFTMVGSGNESITASAKITQLDETSNPGAAVTTTFEEILSKISSGGVVEENCKVECEVTVDYSSNNFDRSELFVQDAYGQGVKFYLTDTSFNDYELGEKLTIHMLGKGFVSGTDGTYFTDLSMDAILDNEDETPLGVEPVPVASIADLDSSMAGTLVSLTSVEYAVPFGTYCNFNESYYGNTVLDYTPILLQDAAGNTITSRVQFGESLTDGATFKYERYLPKGSGEFVGLLQYNTTDGLYIKMRTLEDDMIEQAEDNRMWQHIAEFYWADRSVLNFSGVTPFDLSSATGAGTLFLSGPTTLCYNVGYAYVRTDLSVVSGASVSTAPVSTYQAINSTGAGWTTYYTGSNGTSCSAYEVTVDATAASQVALSISTSSSAAGPGQFTVLYSKDGGATFKESGCNYNPIPWNYSGGPYYAGTLGCQVVLPADAAGSELILRLTPRSSVPANSVDYNSVSATGTNRIAYISVMMK